MRYLLALCMLFALAACQTGQETQVADEPVTDAPVSDEPTSGEPAAAVSDEPTATDPTQPKVPDATHGAEVYARVCVTCHGKTGDGKGMEMKLFGFNEPAETWKNGPTAEGIVKTLNEGIHESSMKSFEEYSEGDRRAVALYVLQLRERLLEAEATKPSMEK